VPVVAYFRARRKLWPAVGLLVGLILIGWDLWAAAGTYISQYAVRNDFRLAYGAALVGIRNGYSRLYDLDAQRAAIESLGPSFNPQPFISPPPLAWLVTPLVLLPFGVALVIWTVLLLAALGWTWYLVAPSGGLAKFAHLALLLGVFPVAFGVMVGQPGALVAAAVATAWWLMRREHPVWAGLALSLVVLKPQMAFLVPICLLVSGHARTFGAWFAASLVIGLVALLLLGPDGVARYRDLLAQTQTPAWDITRRYSISGPIGLGPLLNHDAGCRRRDRRDRRLASSARRPRDSDRGRHRRLAARDAVPGFPGLRHASGGGVARRARRGERLAGRVARGGLRASPVRDRGARLAHPAGRSPAFVIAPTQAVRSSVARSEPRALSRERPGAVQGRRW